MSAQRKPDRPPTFTTSEYVEVDVDIDPDDLEDAGWVYVGKEGTGTTAPSSIEAVLRIVQGWHNATHDGPWRWCQHQPCDDLRGRETGA